MKHASSTRPSHGFTKKLKNCLTIAVFDVEFDGDLQSEARGCVSGRQAASENDLKSSKWPPNIRVIFWGNLHSYYQRIPPNGYSKESQIWQISLTKCLDSTVAVYTSFSFTF